MGIWVFGNILFDELPNNFTDEVIREWFSLLFFFFAEFCLGVFFDLELSLALNNLINSFLRLAFEKCSLYELFPLNLVAFTGDFLCF